MNLRSSSKDKADLDYVGEEMLCENLTDNLTFGQWRKIFITSFNADTGVRLDLE